MVLSYDVTKLHELLESFYTLTKMRIVIFNDSFAKIAQYPDHDCEFCSLIRQNPIAEEQCLISDRKACERCRQQNSIYSYVCHAGLTETVAPIKYSNVVIGYLMFGQVLQRMDKDMYWAEIKERCSVYHNNNQALEEAFYKKQPIETAQIYAAAKILETCAGYLWLSRLITLKENSLPQKIDEYIIGNLTEDLSAAALCTHFQISRSKLHRILKEFFGMGLENLVKSQRVERAKELLKRTFIPIGEVSQQAGFTDYNYFIKVFKKETGYTPLRYRQQNQ